MDPTWCSATWSLRRRSERCDRLVQGVGARPIIRGNHDKVTRRSRMPESFKPGALQSARGRRRRFTADHRECCGEPAAGAAIRRRSWSRSSMAPVRRGRVLFGRANAAPRLRPARRRSASSPHATLPASTPLGRDARHADDGGRERWPAVGAGVPRGTASWSTRRGRAAARRRTRALPTPSTTARPDAHARPHELRRRARPAADPRRGLPDVLARRLAVGR